MGQILELARETKRVNMTCWRFESQPSYTPRLETDATQKSRMKLTAVDLRSVSGDLTVISGFQ